MAFNGLRSSILVHGLLIGNDTGRGWFHFTLLRLGPRVTPDLVGLLEDPREEVRVEASDYLQRFGSIPEGFPVTSFVKGMNDSNRDVRVNCADVLAKMGPGAKDSVQALIQKLQDEDEEVRTSVCRALMFIGPGAREATASLTKYIRDKKCTGCVSRGWALRALESIGCGDQALIECLSEVILDSNREVLVHGLSVLCSRGPDAGEKFPQLLQFLENQDVGIRRFATLAVGRIAMNEKDAIDALRRRLNDEDRWVRIFAADALERVGVEDVDPQTR